MTTIYDGSFGSPVAIGNARVTYPITNFTNLYFVTQEYVQIATAYSQPSYGKSHHIYSQARFCEEIAFSDYGGGLVRFTWRYAKTTNATMLESAREAVSFPGFRLNSYPYTETYTVNSGDVQELRSETKYAYNVVLREPFSREVECTRQTKFVNIFEGEGSEATSSYTKDSLQARSTVKYAGISAKVSFVEDTLVLDVNGQTVNISPTDGRYYLPNAINNSPTYYRGSIPIKYPDVILDLPQDQVSEAILSAYNAQKEDTSTGYTFTPYVSSNYISSNYCSERSIPTINEYSEKIGTFGYQIRPTEIEQFAGSIYKVVETYTNFQ